MKISLSGLYRDTIGLENKVLDLARLEIRPRINEEDLEKQYDEFINRLGTIKDYFEEQEAFKKATEEARGEKRPKIIARDPKHPVLFNLIKSIGPFNFLHPEKRRFSDKYLIAGHCIVRLKTKLENSERKQIVNSEFQKDLEDKFAQYPGYEGIIEIPNDRTLIETKSTTFHEGLHYLIFRYQANTGRMFIKEAEDLSERDRYIRENILHEKAVEILTDKLLTHDQEALFESRWPFYHAGSLVSQGIMLVSGLSMIGIGFTAGLINPYLLPLMLIPGRIEAIVQQKYKESKKKELIKPVEYPKFKI